MPPSTNPTSTPHPLKPPTLPALSRPPPGPPPIQPHSPIRRVVRAANAARRRTLRRASADAFPFDAIHRRLHRREPNSPRTHATASSHASRHKRPSKQTRPQDGHLTTSTTATRLSQDPSAADIAAATGNASSKPSPMVSRLLSRRRSDLRTTLLSFPEHDATTVATLLSLYQGDRNRVYAKLSQARRQSGDSDAAAVVQDALTSVDGLGLPAMDIPPQSHPSQSPPSQSPPSQLSDPWSQSSTEARALASAGGVLVGGSLKQTMSEGVGTIRRPRTATAEGRRLTGMKRLRSERLREDSPPRLLRSRMDGALADAGRAETGRAIGIGVGESSDEDGTSHWEASASGSASVVRHESSVGVEDWSEEDGSKDVSHESDTSTSTAGSTAGSTAASATSEMTGMAQDVKEEFVRRLQRRVEELETRLVTLTEDSTRLRKELSKRVHTSERGMTAMEQRVEALGVEVEDNLSRVGKTEQYLDAMRRDLVATMGRRRWPGLRLVRAMANNTVYYLLAYLVPVLAFVVRLVRDVLLHLRSRHGPGRRPH